MEASHGIDPDYRRIAAAVRRRRRILGASAGHLVNEAVPLERERGCRGHIYRGKPANSMVAIAVQVHLTVESGN
jgi:hypothetical protein